MKWRAARSRWERPPGHGRHRDDRRRSVCGRETSHKRGSASRSSLWWGGMKKAITAEFGRVGRHGRRLRRTRQSLRTLRSRAWAPEIVRNVRKDHLTMLSAAALHDLWCAVREVERRHVPGAFIEAGCARGGSAIVLAAAKASGRPLLLYDTFGLIPSPSTVDGDDVRRRYETIATGRALGIGKRPYYGYVADLESAIRNSFREHGLSPEQNQVETRAGLYQDTLYPEQAIAFAHIDCDWFDSVKVCLDRITPHLSPGGTLVIDDYEAWPGCTQAVDEFLTDTDLSFEHRWRSRLHLVRR